MKKIQARNLQAFINSLDKFDIKKEDYPDEDSQLFFLMSDFVLDFIDLRRKNNISQKDVAQAIGTKQASISRFENLNTKPTIEYLFKVSKAVGGELYINPNGKYTYTVPEKFRSAIEKKAINDNASIEEIVKDSFEKGFNLNNIRVFDLDVNLRTKFRENKNGKKKYKAPINTDDFDIDLEGVA